MDAGPGKHGHDWWLRVCQQQPFHSSDYNICSKKLAHFVIYYVFYLLLSIPFRMTSAALEQSSDCPSASEVTLEYIT